MKKDDISIALATLYSTFNDVSDEIDGFEVLCREKRNLLTMSNYSRGYVIFHFNYEELYKTNDLNKAYGFISNHFNIYSKLSLSIKKRFVKDFGLPIDILKEPYFSEKIEFLDSEFDSKRKLNLLMETIEKIGSEVQFFKETEKIIKIVQNSIIDHPAYKLLQADKLEDENMFINYIKGKYNITKDFYKEHNLNKVFLSIDLKEANFNSFKSKGVFKEESYKEMMKKFTSLDYFLESKHIRQVVFGSLLPKKQTLIQEYEVSKILDSLNIEFQSVVLKKDEIVLEISEDLYFNHLDLLNNIKSSINTIYPIKIDRFNLLELRDKKDNLYFVKDYGHTTEIKGVSKVFYTQAYKKFMKQEITKDDLVFSYEGNTAFFKESIF